MDVKKQRKILISLIIVVLILLGIFLTLFFLRNNSEKTVVTHKAATNISKKNDKIADLTIKQAAGLAIVYAHLRYEDDQSWSEIYQAANNGELEVDRYLKYQFDNYTVTPQNNQALYIVNKEAYLIFTNQQTPMQGKIILGNDQQKLETTNVHMIYKYVKKQGKLAVAKAISQKMHLETQMATQQESQSKQSSSSTQSNSSSRRSTSLNNGLQPVTISSKLQGNWIAAGLFTEELGQRLPITVNAIDGKTIYKLNKMPNSTKSLKQFGEKYHNKLFAVRENNDGIACVPAQALQTDAMAYSLINIDGVQCLLEGSTGPAGLYFRNGSDAQRFTQKYQKHENALLKKLMN